MKGIERQAIRTDAAIASVGTSLDGLSSQQRLRRMSQAQRSVRALGNEGEAAERGIQKAERGLNGLEKESNKAKTAFRGLAQAFRDFAVLAKPAIFVGIGTAIGVAVQAVGALSGGVVGLLPKLVDLVGVVAPAGAGIVGLGLAAVTAKLAFSGFSKALGGNAQALKQLTPEARKFLTELKSYKPLMKELRESAQGGLFPGLSAAMKTLTSGPGVGALNRLVGQFGQRMGGVAQQVASRVSAKDFVADFETIGNQGGRMLTQLASALLDLVDVFRNFAVAAQPFTDWMTKAVVGWAAHRKEMSLFNRDSGRTAQFLDRTRTSLELMVRIGKNLWETLRNLGQAARPLGDALWSGIDRATKRWADYTGSVKGSVSLTKQFTAMAPAIKQIAGLVGDLGKAIFAMGSDRQLAGTAANLRTLVGPLQAILTGLANNIGPPLATALATLGQALTQMGGLNGPLVMFLNAVNGILRGFIAVSRVVPGFGRIVGAALSVALIARFLVKLGLLEAQWWRVGRAAGAAAVAENAAAGSQLSMGMVGPGVGKGILGTKLAGRFPATAERLAGVGARLGSVARVGSIGLIASTVAGPLVGGLTGSKKAGSIAGSMATGAALGATLGSFIGPEGTVIGGIAGGALGLGRGLMQNQGQSAEGQINAARHEAQIGLARGEGSGGGAGQAAYEIGVFQRALKALTGVTGAAADAQRASFQQEIAARRGVIAQLHQEAVGRRMAASAAYARAEAGGLQRGYALSLRQGETKGQALTDLNARAQLDMARLTKSDRTKFGRGLYNWERGEAPGSPQLAALRAQLGSILPPGQRGGRVQAFTGSVGELGGINKRLGLYDEQKRQAQAAMTPVQKLAYLSLIARGFTPSEAARIVGLADQSGHGVGQPTTAASKAGGLALTPSNPWNAAAGSGKFGLKNPIPLVLHVTVAAPTAQPAYGTGLWGPGGVMTAGNHAGGGRIPGSGLSDSVPLGGGMAAPGELVVNRHTERRVNAMLGGRASLGGLVDGENRRHSDRFATGGRASGLQPGISRVSQAVLSQFPGLSVTSTTGGQHAPNSYHYKGMAVDIAGAPDLMNQAGSWVQQHMAGQLLEGIHNSTLSVKNGQTVPSSFWGASTWAGHMNHLHLAAGAGASGASGGGGGTSTVGATVARAATPTPGNRAVIGQALGTEGARQRALASISGFGGMGLSSGSAAAPRSAVPSATASGTRPAGAGRAGTAAAPVANGSLQGVLTGAGFSGENLKIAQAVMRAESGGNPMSHNAVPPDDSYGLFQINMLGALGPARRRQFGLATNSQLFDPATNARAAYAISSGGTNWNPWTTYTSGAYQQYMAKGGRVPSFAGWFQKGGAFETSGPTMFGAGESGKERVQITKAGGHGGMSTPTQIIVHVHGGGPEVYEMARAGAAAALDEFADKMDRVGVA